MTGLLVDSHLLHRPGHFQPMKRRRSARISVQQPLKRKRNLARAATNKQKIEDETSEEIEEVAIDSSNQTECPFDTDEEALIGRFPVIQQRDWKQQEYGQFYQNS